MSSRSPVWLLVVMALGLAAGCTSSSTSNTARTAKEQLLLSNAVDQSLDKVDFTPLFGHRVFLDEKYLECVDKGYVVGSLRHRILRSGGILAAAADDADVVMEVRSGGVGTDTSDAYLGTPEIVLPGMLTLPEVRVVERRAQSAFSKLAIVTYDAKTRHVLGDGGLSLARSNDNNWFAFGLGPYQNGSLKGEVAKANMVPPGTYRRQLPAQVALRSRDGSAGLAGAPAEGTAGEPNVRFASESQKK